MAALRRYFDGLRRPSDDLCTTRIDYAISIFEGDRLVHRETLVDERCAELGEDEVTPLGLLYRAAPAHPIFRPRARFESAPGS